MGRQTLASSAAEHRCARVDHLGQAIAEPFQTHPDHAIITSVPAWPIPPALVCPPRSERSDFANARSLNAYAGSAPITRAAGKSIAITCRRIKHDRLAAVGRIWAFAMARQTAA